MGGSVQQGSETLHETKIGIQDTKREIRELRACMKSKLSKTKLKPQHMYQNELECIKTMRACINTHK